MKNNTLKNILVYGIIFLLIFAGVFPIINAQQSMYKENKKNDNLRYSNVNNNPLEIFKIQEINNGIVTKEYKKELPFKKAVDLFIELVQAKGTISKIELLDNQNIISKNMSYGIKNIINNLYRREINNTNNKLEISSDTEEFNFTDNSTLVFLNRLGPGLFLIVRSPHLMIKIAEFLINFTMKYSIIGRTISILSWLPLFISSLTITYGSLLVHSMIPIWPFLLIPEISILLSSFQGFIGIKTKNYNLTGIGAIVATINGFTGIKIDSVLFGAMFLGYAKKIEASGFFI